MNFTRRICKRFRWRPRRDRAIFVGSTMAALVVMAMLCGAPPLYAQAKQPAWSEQEKPIAQAIGHLRDLPDERRAGETKRLALQIRQLPVTNNKLELANDLADLSTEGDFGHDTVQEVATTLAEALREMPPSPAKRGQPADAFIELAELVRYEHVQASADNPQYAAAMAQLETEDVHRQHIDFTLKDLNGMPWTLSQLRGKVVLVNFWATWCPPCRKEMPDLDVLYRRFKDDGFVVLSISDEDKSKVLPFLAEHKVTYPVLLDPGRKVNDLFEVQGIPRTFIYGRDGKLAAQSIDMRTQKQFLVLLAQAGLH